MKRVTDKQPAIGEEQKHWLHEVIEASEKYESELAKGMEVSIAQVRAITKLLRKAVDGVPTSTLDMMVEYMSKTPLEEIYTTLRAHHPLGYEATMQIKLIKYLSSGTGRAVATHLNEPRYTVKDTDLTYRVATHWEATGVLPETRPDGKGWRRLNIKEGVMVRAFMQLREFGFSLEQLRSVRESIETLHIEERDYNHRGLYFEFYLSQAIANRTPTCMIVFSDCSVELVSFNQYKENLQRFLEKDHVVVMLNSVLEWFFPEGNLSPEYSHPIEVSDDEREVLFLLRTGTYDNITLRAKSGKVHTIEAEEIIKDKRRLIDILNDELFQDFSVKRRDGKIVYATRSIIKKL